MQLLLVEPDKVLADIYAAGLARAGHEVSCAATAQQAILQADSHAPDIVVLELQLLVHNGMEFLYEFRSYAEWSQIPVIILSTVPRRSFSAASSLWQELGVVAYLYKPQASLEKLIQTVAAWAPARA